MASDHAVGQLGGSRGKRFAQKVTLLLVSLLLTAFIVEVCVRVFYRPAEFAIDPRYCDLSPGPFRLRFTPSQTIVIHVPGMENDSMAVALNRHGFRGPDIDEVAKCQVRVVSIGDSFTFGWGLADLSDQCVAGFVDDYASTHTDNDIGMSVLALPGWGPSDYLAAYKEFGSGMKPDLVVLGFFCGDDIVVQGTVASVRAAVRPRVVRASPPPRPAVASLSWARAMVRESPILTKLALSVGIRPSGDLVRFLRAEPDPMPARWAETLQILADLHDRIRRDGGRFVIVSFPSLIQVYAREQLDDAQFDYRLIDTKLEAFCEVRGITFIPFLPALLADGKLDLYYAEDRHLTPRGQSVCKGVLRETLTPVLDRIVVAKKSR